MNKYNIRWCLILIGLLLNITNYTISPYRISTKRNPLINISYKNIFFSIYMILFIIDIIYIIYLNSFNKPISNFPNIWWMALVIIFGVYLINLYINSNYINLTCNNTSIDKCYYKPNCIIDTTLNKCEDKFIEKPVIFLSKTKRTILNIIILLIFGISYIYEYYLNKPEIKNILSYFAWIRIISIVFIIYITITSVKYIPCKYGLPTNWY
jgi:hypothetical protein